MSARQVVDSAAVSVALNRLFAIARSDTGQSKRVADFLLAWHNAGENGGWDPTDLWSVDEAVADDMVTVVTAIRHLAGRYPGDVGYQAQIDRVWQEWRAHHTAKPRRSRR